MDINSFGIRNSTAQYDGFCTGEFGTSVNLFRGEAFFDYPLIRGLPEKNGIGIKVLAAYSSNTDHTARTDNITEPTGVMGLGWQFGYPAIMRADTGQILPPGQEVFYYNNTEGMSRLYQTARQWIIAELDKEVQQEFDKHEVSDTLSGVFAENGIVVTTGSKLYKEAGYYLLEDCVEEIENIWRNRKQQCTPVYCTLSWQYNAFNVQGRTRTCSKAVEFIKRNFNMG